MTKQKNKDRPSIYLNIVVSIITISILTITSGCETRAQTGTLAGTGIGALVGQAIGRSTEATLIGAAIGAGAGYIIGNEQDKKAAKEYDLNQPTVLTGTKWQVVNLVMEEKPEFISMFVEFKSNGEVVTTRHEPGGTMTITEERYRIVGDTLIINKTDYIINAKYVIQGDTMTVNCQQFRAVLSRIG